MITTRRQPLSMHKSPAKQKGVVLILVLSIFAFAAIVSGELSYQSHREFRRTSTILLQNEAYIFAKGGETFAVQKLLADTLYDKQSGLNADYLTEAWAIESAPYEIDASSSDTNQSAEGESESATQDIGELIIIIEDLQARFNLNNIQYKQSGHASGIDQFENLLKAAIRKGKQTLNSVDIDTDIDQPVEPQVLLDISPNDLARALLDWVDEDSESILITGSEDNHYEQLQNPYRTANQEISHHSELKAITGFYKNDYEIYNLLMAKRFFQSEGTDDENNEEVDVEEDQGQTFTYDENGELIIELQSSADKYWGGIQHFVSSLPYPTKINVNTAPAEVLQTLFTEEEANLIIQGREGSPYQRVEDIFLNLETIKKKQRDKYTAYLSVDSQYFQSTVIAKVGETKFVLQSTLYRDGKGRVRVLSREFSR